MRPVRSRQGVGSRAAPSVALSGNDAWAAPPGAAGEGQGLRTTDRLSWPVAIAVTAGLSAALWIGIAWLAYLAFG
jgi:hypothetical protein